MDCSLLLKLIEARPVLWNKNHQDYLNKARRKEAWLEVAAEMTEEFDGLSVPQQEEVLTILDKKWRNLRDAWLKSRRKSNQRKKYIYDEEISFLEQLYNDNSLMGTSPFISTPQKESKFIDIDCESLIKMVEERPALWDRRMPEFKAVQIKEKLWNNVATNLNSEFVEMSPSEQKEYAAALMRKWGYLKDAWSKWEKKVRKNKSLKNKYRYSYLMSFLKSTQEDKDVFEDDDNKKDSEMIGTSEQDSGEESETNIFEDEQPMSPPRKIPKIEIDEFGMSNVITAVEIGEGQSNMLFFQNVMSMTNDFNVNESVQLQIGVLHIVRDILSKRKRAH